MTWIELSINELFNLFEKLIHLKWFRTYLPFRLSCSCLGSTWKINWTTCHIWKNKNGFIKVSFEKTIIAPPKLFFSLYFWKVAAVFLWDNCPRILKSISTKKDVIYILVGHWIGHHEYFKSIVFVSLVLLLDCFNMLWSTSSWFLQKKNGHIFLNFPVIRLCQNILNF